MAENLVLFGPPGVGKGTQAQHLSAAFRIPHIATGDMLRATVQSDSPLGRQIGALINNGNFVPDEMMVEVVRERIAQPDAREGFLLDGFPRTTNQAGILKQMMASTGRNIDAVLVLQAPDEVLVARLAGRRTCETCQKSYHLTARPPRRAGVCDRCGGKLVQRADDAEQTVRHRLAVYAEKTKPVLDYFKADNWPLRIIDADGDIDQVFGRVYAAVFWRGQ